MSTPTSPVHLTPRARRVLDRLRGLARLCDSVFPKRATLAKWLGYAVRTVAAAVRELRDAGLLATRRRGRTSAVYTLTELGWSWQPPPPPDPDPDPDLDNPAQLFLWPSARRRQARAAAGSFTPRVHPGCASACTSNCTSSAGDTSKSLQSSDEKTMVPGHGVCAHNSTPGGSQPRPAPRLPRPDHARPSPKALKPGSLPNLTPREMRDPAAMLGVFRRFVAAYGAERIADDPRRQLRFFGLAARALRVARKPGAMFRRLLAAKRFDWISQADENQASAWIKRAREAAERGGPNTMGDVLRGWGSAHVMPAGVVHGGQ